MVEIESIVSTISVFKTNVNSSQESKVLTLLNLLEDILKINFDFEDCDDILRIESNVNLAKEIVVLLDSNGFYCEELD